MGRSRRLEGKKVSRSTIMAPAYDLKQTKPGQRLISLSPIL